MRDHLHTDADIAMTPYQFYLQLEADSMGSPYDWAMRDVQEQARLWKFSELILHDCHRRPGMAFVWNPFVHQLQVFYREKVPGQSDRLMVAYKDFNTGQWYSQDTGISPSTADSALTAAYQYDFFVGKIFQAWTRYDLSVYHTWRNQGGSWASPQSLPGVLSTHAPVIAAGSDVRLFYRNAETGSLSFVVWNGSSWGSPVNLTSLVGQAAREPAVEWDGSKYVVIYVSGAQDAAGEVKYIEITPGVGGGPDSYSSPPPVTFHECAYTTGPHNWSGQITAAMQSGKLHLLGFREDVALHQAAMTKESGHWKFWHHAYTERVGDEVVVRSGAPGLYAALWSWDPNDSTASIFSK